MTTPLPSALLTEAAIRLQALAPGVLAAQLGQAVTADGIPPLPGLQGQAFQLPLRLAQGLPATLHLWLAEDLLAQHAAAWNHGVSPADIGCELANVLAGQLLTQLAAADTDASMGLPAAASPDRGATAAPRASDGWWRCPPHWLHLALLPEGESPCRAS